MRSEAFRYGVIARIDCAHHLVGGGLCEAVHGHTYKVEVVASGPGLGLQGLQAHVERYLEPFDHKDLNELFETPTCEHFSQAVFDGLHRQLPGLRSVKIWEGHGKWAEVRSPSLNGSAP
jgi:6-pyruvoyltetrahydropterin/6-carboxytetrahydropterin synthase